MTILSADQLVKTYAPGSEVGPFNFGLEAGHTLAVIGANGAGKSTLFQMITGNLDASRGEVRLFGEKMASERFDLKRRLGYLPQHLELPKWVTGREILTYAVHLYDLDPSVVEESLKVWDCQTFSKRPLGACSHGMRKRISLALATVHKPDLLILDEPFSGLDLFHIKALDDLLLERRRRGATTILSTHISPYAARLCSRAVVIRNRQLAEISGWAEADQDDRVRLIDSLFFPA